MQKLSIIIVVLSLIFVVTGCSPKDDVDGSAAPSTSSSPTQPENPTETPSASPDDTQPEPSSENNDVYTKVIQIEGMDENVNYQRINGSYGYTIPIDIDRFEFKPGEDTDNYPSLANDKVYMAVSYLEDATAADAAASLTADNDITSADESAITVGEYDATNIHAVYGGSPDSKIIDYYLIESNGGVYIISNVYFLEAAEGFGARMYDMTQDFKIL